MRTLALAALLALSQPALACGFCVEDKMAAVETWPIAPCEALAKW